MTSLQHLHFPLLPKSLAGLKFLGRLIPIPGQNGPKFVKPGSTYVSFQETWETSSNTVACKRQTLETSQNKNTGARYDNDAMLWLIQLAGQSTCWRVARHVSAGTL